VRHDVQWYSPWATHELIDRATGVAAKHDEWLRGLRQFPIPEGDRRPLNLRHGDTLTELVRQHIASGKKSPTWEELLQRGEEIRRHDLGVDRLNRLERQAVKRAVKQRIFRANEKNKKKL
jgi:hypothetical protein